MFEILDRDHISFRLTSTPNVTVALLPSLTTGTTTENTGYFVWIVALTVIMFVIIFMQNYSFFVFLASIQLFFSALILHLLTTFLRDYGDDNLNNNLNIHNNNTISWGGLAGTTPKDFSNDGKKNFLVLCAQWTLFIIVRLTQFLKYIAPFQINRTRFSPPTITQKGDEELSTKKTYRYWTAIYLYAHA